MHASPLRDACILLHFNANLIFEGADGRSNRLIFVENFDIAIVVVQVSVPGVVVVVLGGTPEESVVSNIVKTTIVIAITT